jgi:hypothetical protein
MTYEAARYQINSQLGGTGGLMAQPFFGAYDGFGIHRRQRQCKGRPGLDNIALAIQSPLR